MIDIWSRFHVACSSRLSLVKIWRTFAYVEGQQNINVYDVRQPFVSCVLPKFRILNGCRVETDDESVLEDMASNETRPVQLETENGACTSGRNEQGSTTRCYI